MATTIAAHLGPWTEDDLADIPEEYGRRCELLEGALVVNPPPSSIHQAVSWEVTGAIKRAAPSGVMVLEALGVRLPDQTVLIPDVLAGEREAMLAATGGIVDAAAVRLVVEIVSPGSRTADRLTKPALYAAAGILAFWRVELEPELAVVAHRLDAGRYVEMASATAGEELVTDEPFAVSLDPASLRP